ncbi:hypothetical protein [Nonomuraea sp. LPB2021202275-12-8]|uniref:hypothetical protein n=1 Tax=Nonomuraea sp. LPB2021202275-12-8 TaxID=3120159 RepID=UPI00300D89AF
MDDPAPRDVRRRVWTGVVRPIPVALVSSVLVVWLTVLVVPGIHADGPPLRVAQAIAVSALVFLIFAIGGRALLLVSSLRQRAAGPSGPHGTDGDSGRAPREPASLPTTAMVVMLGTIPLALWLSEALCAALGLPLRIDDLGSLLAGSLAVGVVRLLIGAVLKLAVMARRSLTAGPPL